MHIYPASRIWLVAIVLLIALLLALPNVFGEAPAVQLSRNDRAAASEADIATVKATKPGASALTFRSDSASSANDWKYYPVNVSLTAPGAWTMNGDEALPSMDCVDLDLGFTPATNLISLRRLDLPVGQRATTFTAWLDEGTARLEVVEHVYRRQAGGTYAYEAPRFDYKALLEVDPTGFVRRYPTLWEAVTEE